MGCKKHIILSICTVLIANPANADRIIQVEPGLWEYSHNLIIPGILTPSDKPQTHCITSKDAKQNLSQLFRKLAVGNAKCTIKKLKDTLNTVKFDLSCHPDIDGLKITSSGKAAFRYGRTKISGTVSGKMKINQGAPIFLDGTGTARRIGRCHS